MNNVLFKLYSLSVVYHSLTINCFYRYLMVESEDHESEKDQKTKDMYYSVFRRFSDVLVKVGHVL
jgi:hypothetical protein